MPLDWTVRDRRERRAAVGSDAHRLQSESLPRKEAQHIGAARSAVMDAWMRQVGTSNGHTIRRGGCPPPTTEVMLKRNRQAAFLRKK